MFKRAASILVMIAMMFTMSSMFFVTTAAKPLQFVLEPRATTCYAGGTCLIDVKVSNIPEEGISGIKFQLDYNETIMELRYESYDKTGVTLGDAFAGVSAVPSLVYDPQKKIAILAGASGIWSEEALITLKFDIKNEGLGCSPTVKITTDDATDGSTDNSEAPKQISIAAGETTISIASFKWGDANGNGATDSRDVILVLRRAVDLCKDEDLNVEASDVDGLKGIRVGDAILILRYLLDFYKPWQD